VPKRFEGRVNIEIVKHRTGGFCVCRKVTPQSAAYQQRHIGWYEYWNGDDARPTSFSLASFGDEYARKFPSNRKAATAFLCAALEP
jgi:hypothetical protein